MSARRERLAWAALFALAPAAGIAFATAKVGLLSMTDPLVLGAFAVTAVVMFAVVFGAASVGSTNVPEQEFE